MIGALMKGMFARRPERRKSARKAKPSGFMAKVTLAADRYAFAWPVRQGLYRHLAAQVRNGVPVEDALEMYRSRLQRRGKVSSDKIVADVIRRMRDGSTLAEAMQKWVPNDEFGVIESGELSGNLPEGLELIVDAKRRLQSVKAAIKGAMTTPAVYVLLVYGVMFTIGQLVPELESTLPRERATGMVYALYVAGEITNSWWMLLPVSAAVGIAAAVVATLPKWTGPRRVKAENWFPYSFYRDLQGYTWLIGFAALLKAGQPDVEILKRQKEGATPWLKERLHSIWWRMDNGKSLPASLLAKGRNGAPSFGFPNPDIVDEIESMAGFADFPDRIVIIAREWAQELQEETVAKAKRFGFYAEMLMYMIMGLLFMAMNSLSSQIGGGVPVM